MGGNKINALEHVDSTIEAEAAKFEKWYQELQSMFQVFDLHEDKSFLVTSVANKTFPIHSWYTLKEAYSPELPVWILEYLREKYDALIISVLDPFIGGGTTGVSLAQNGISVDGLEYNPFIYLVAKTKSQYPCLDACEIQESISCLNLSDLSEEIELPLLTTFHNPEYFRSADVRSLMNIIRQIGSLECSDATRNFLLLGVAASIDDVANLRKDGRALRYTQKLERPTAVNAFRSRLSRMIGDLGKAKFSGSFNVINGSALDLSHITSQPTYDLVLFSPPYLNNFDYSEIYKLELWLLGLVRSREAWQALRRKSLRSHPSISFEPTARLISDLRTNDIGMRLKDMESSICLGDDNIRRQMRGVITGYFDDIYESLNQQWKMLKPGGYLVYIVANSRHKWLPIASDVIIAEIARRIGFQPLDLLILKKRNGRTRQKAFLHESVAILRKPMS